MLTKYHTKQKLKFFFHIMALRSDKKYTDKFKLPSILNYDVVSLRGVARNWEKPLEATLHSPKSLVDMCADIVDSLPLPECMYWRTDEVVNWMENTVHLPQYNQCFEINYIDGRHLILLGPSQLVRMNITSYEHIMHIMEEIRKLYCVPRSKFARDLTRPNILGTEYDWITLYYRFVARQSPHKAELRSSYWRKAKMLNDKSYYICHWYNIKPGQDIHGKVIISRVLVHPTKKRWFVPVFRENNYLPTKIKVDYLDNDPLTW